MQAPSGSVWFPAVAPLPVSLGRTVPAVAAASRGPTESYGSGPGDSRSSNFGLRQEGFPAIESNVQSKAGSRSEAWSPEPEASGKIARVGHAWPHEPPSMSAELCCVAGCPGPSVHLQTEEMKPPPQWSRRPRGLRARGEGVTVGVTVVASQPGGPTSRSSHPPSCIRVDLCDQWNKTSHIQL